MKMISKLLAGLFVSMGFLAFDADAQGGKGENDAYKSDFTYEKRTTEERKVIPYPPLRQADVMYARRIHQQLDVREKQNLAMQWPKNPFNCLVYDAVMEGIRGKQLTPYKNDSLIGYYTREEVIDRISEEEVITIRPDPINRPDYTIDSTIQNTLQCQEITKFRIMEDWIFDKETSQYFPRIIAIAPLYEPKRGGTELGELPIFWVKWSQLRKILVNEPMYNRHNDAAAMSYYDFFEQRLYSSYIVKYPNEFDIDINDMPRYEGDKFAALLKAQEVEAELFNFEHDLWQY